MGSLVKIVCPACGLNRPAKAFATDNEDKKFGSWDGTRQLIQVRGIPGGKASDMYTGSGRYRRAPGKGFPTIASYTLAEAKDMADYQEYVAQIKTQLLKVLKIFKDNGLISDEELETIQRG